MEKLRARQKVLKIEVKEEDKEKNNAENEDGEEEGDSESKNKKKTPLLNKHNLLKFEEPDNYFRSNNYKIFYKIV